jgi:uncharacterized Tic20 family protein
MDLATQLERLGTLRDSGALSEQEYQEAKRKLLLQDSPQDDVPVASPVPRDDLFGFTEPTYCMLMHLSQLLIFLGGFGVVVPIVIWAIGKDKSPTVKRHGNRMMNWIISSAIYAIGAGVLCFVFIGIPLVIAVMILMVAFPVIAALKANSGQDWKYPLAIRFLPDA